MQPAYLNQEALFEVHEMFVSRTDKKGIILSGNDVFARISGYSPEELLGAPHSIIRHRDMPKCVFFLLWKKLHANEIVAAYVKNRAKDGSYYWVLATAFPVKGGYLSVRIKPVSPIKPIVEEVYKEALEFEKTHTQEESLGLVVSKLKTLGFDSYESFMLKVLVTELKMRDQMIAERAATIGTGAANLPDRATASRVTRILLEMLSTSEVAASAFAKTINGILEYDGFKTASSANSEKISKACDRLGNLAVNMSITAHKLGKEGGGLGVIASSFQHSADTVLKSYDAFKTASTEVSMTIENILINSSCLRLQIEMLSFYIREVINRIRNLGEHGIDRRVVQSEMKVLTENVRELFATTLSQNTRFLSTLHSLHRDTQVIQSQLTRLDLIRMGGKLEGSRSMETAESFKPFVAEMARFVDEIGPAIAETNSLVNGLIGAFTQANSQIKKTEHVVGSLGSFVSYLASDYDDSKAA